LEVGGGYKASVNVGVHCAAAALGNFVLSLGVLGDLNLDSAHSLFGLLLKTAAEIEPCAESEEDHCDNSAGHVFVA
jgi:hypothetical protein